MFLFFCFFSAISFFPQLTIFNGEKSLFADQERKRKKTKKEKKKAAKLQSGTESKAFFSKSFFHLNKYCYFNYL